MDLARTLKPFPPEVLAHLLSAYHSATVESRAALAADSWNKVSEKQCTAEDMDFLYEKLSVTCPIILGKAPMPKIDEALLLDPTYPGQCACDGKIASIKNRPVKLGQLVLRRNVSMYHKANVLSAEGGTLGIGPSTPYFATKANGRMCVQRQG